jgi:hypothetical protein
MRYRTAAILSVVLIGGMFGLPIAVKAVFPSVSTAGSSQPGTGIRTNPSCRRWFLPLLAIAARASNPSGAIYDCGFH